MKHPFIQRYEKEDVDVGAWYRATQRGLNGGRARQSAGGQATDSRRSGDSLRNPSTMHDATDTRASSTDPSAAFKPQPSPRIVRSSLAATHDWRQTPVSSTSSASGPHNGIVSGPSVISSTYFNLRPDRNNPTSQLNPQQQKVIFDHQSYTIIFISSLMSAEYYLCIFLFPFQSSSVLPIVASSSASTAVYPSAIGEQQRERERERNELLRAEREREIQQLQQQRRNSHDRRTSFDSILDSDGRHRTPHRSLHHQVHIASIHYT